MQRLSIQRSVCLCCIISFIFPILCSHVYSFTFLRNFISHVLILLVSLFCWCPHFWSYNRVGTHMLYITLTFSIHSTHKDVFFFFFQGLVDFTCFNRSRHRMPGLPTALFPFDTLSSVILTPTWSICLCLYWSIL